MLHTFSARLVLGVAFALAAPALAQQNPPPAPVVAPALSTEPEVALDELIARALQNNPQLPAARETLEAARQSANAARALESPVLQIVPGLGNREARDEEIILSQPLDLFGKRRARGAVADAQVRAAQSQNTLAQNSLIVAVKNAATQLFAAQEAQSLGEVQIEIARLFLQAAARRAALGDVPAVQEQRATLELARAQNELSNARAQRLVARATLNQLVGQAPETPLRVSLPDAANFSALRLPGDVATPSVSVSPQAPEIGASSQIGSDLVALRAQLLPTALERPDLLDARATLEGTRAQIEVIKRQRRPDLEIQARRSSVTGSGSTALRAVLVVPLLDYGANRGERRALEAQARAQTAQLELLRSQVAVQIESSLIGLEQSRQNVARYGGEIVPLTLELLRKTQLGYAAGASTFLEVLDAQRTLKTVQTEYLQALVGARLGEAMLESALGAALPANLSATVNPTGPPAPPGVAAPGTVPPDTIPPNVVAPLDPLGAGVK